MARYEIQPIAGTTHKASKSEGDADEHLDSEEQSPTREEYDAPRPLMCAKESDPPKRTPTRSVTRLRNFPEPSTVSGIKIRRLVDMGKLIKGRRALSSPSDAA